MLAKAAVAMLKAKQGNVLTIPNAVSELEIVLEDGRSEKFILNSTCPTEFIVSEPIVQENGETTIPLEILKFEVATTSKVLWPGEKVIMSGGRNIGHEALSIHGTVYIPKGKQLSDGVKSEQLVYIQVECPLGKLHNVTAVPMIGTITGIPPVGVRFKTTNIKTPLFDNDMNRKMFVVACNSVQKPE